MEALFRLIRISPFDDGRSFRKYITGPLKAGEDKGYSNLQTLLRAILLRRSIDVLTTLSGVDEIQRIIQLSPSERSLYDNITSESKDAIEEQVCSGNTQTAHRTIFQAITKLRLLCNLGISMSAVCARPLPCATGSTTPYQGLLSPPTSVPSPPTSVPSPPSPGDGERELDNAPIVCGDVHSNEFCQQCMGYHILQQLPLRAANFDPNLCQFCNSVISEPTPQCQYLDQVTEDKNSMDIDTPASPSHIPPAVVSTKIAAVVDDVAAVQEKRFSPDRSFNV